jgi:hypothetical protein
MHPAAIALRTSNRHPHRSRSARRPLPPAGEAEDQRRPSMTSAAMLLWGAVFFRRAVLFPSPAGGRRCRLQPPGATANSGAGPKGERQDGASQAAENCSCIFGISAIHGGQMRVVHPVAMALRTSDRHPHPSRFARRPLPPAREAERSGAGYSMTSRSTWLLRSGLCRGGTPPYSRVLAP